MINAAIKSISLQLATLITACLALSPLSVSAEVEPEPLIGVEISAGGDDLLTSEVRAYFERLGRNFHVFRGQVITTTPAKEVYKLHRERAGNFRYNALKVSNATFYSALAKSVRENFRPLDDDVHYDDSEVSGVEFLQIVFRQAKALTSKKADLESTDGTVTSTYVYDDKRMILMPTTFHYREGASNTEGTELESHFGVNSFSKHFLLASILNKRARVTMAGKFYIKVVPRDEGAPLDLAHVFDENGDVDLEAYAFEVTVTNESGTFKPAGEGLPPFAQLLVEQMELEEVHYRAHVSPGQEPIEGTAYRTAPAE